MPSSLLSQEQMIAAVLRYFLANDPQINTPEEVRAAQQFVRSLDPETLSAIATSIQGNRAQARMFSDEPEASVPPPAPPPEVPMPGPEKPGSIIPPGGPYPPATDIIREARRFGGAGGGGRLGLPMLGQGGVAPGERWQDAQEGVPSPVTPPGERWQDQPRATPTPRPFQGVPLETVTRQDLPPPAVSGPSLAQQMDAITGPVEEMYQFVARMQDRRFVPALLAMVSQAKAQANLLPPGERDEMQRYLGETEQSITRLYQTLPAERAPGADQGPAWANVAIAQRGQALREAEFEYKQGQDIMDRQQQLRAFRGWDYDPETGEIVKSPTLLQLEESRLQHEASQRLSEAGLTGRLDGELTIAGRQEERAVEAARKKIIGDMARDFASFFSNQFQMRGEAEKELREQAKLVRYPEGAEYIPGWEPGGFREGIHRQLGISFTPRRVQEYGIPLTDPYARMREYEEQQRRLLRGLYGEEPEFSRIAGLL